MSAPAAVHIALSDLYLDTEMQPSTHHFIARTLLAARISPEEAWHIDKYEVFPVLYDNLFSVAGIWDGFQDEWLLSTIASSLACRNWLRTMSIELGWMIFSGMQQHDRQKVAEQYDKLRQAHDPGNTASSPLGG